MHIRSKLLPKIHYDLTQVVVVNFIVTTFFWYNTTYSVKCYFVGIQVIST